MWAQTFSVSLLLFRLVQSWTLLRVHKAKSTLARNTLSKMQRILIIIFLVNENIRIMLQLSNLFRSFVWLTVWKIILEGNKTRELLIRWNWGVIVVHIRVNGGCWCFIWWDEVGIKKVLSGVIISYIYNTLFSVYICFSISKFIILSPYKTKYQCR